MAEGLSASGCYRVHVLRRALLVLALSACASEAETSSLDQTARDGGGPSLAGWTELSQAPGASLRARESVAGDDVLVVYGGCGATQLATQSFAEALSESPNWRRAPRHLVAIRWTSNGCGYDGLFKNGALGPLILQKAGAAGRVVVVAHSSGAYLAQELLAQSMGLANPGWDPTHSLRGRVTYFSLDGGGDANLTRIEQSADAPPRFFVGARDRTAGLTSRNYGTMQALGGPTRFFEVDANGSGCLAANCMHDAVITTVPHDKRSFLDAQGTSRPLWCDYGHFSNRPDAACAAADQQAARANARTVVSSYLSKL